MKSILTTLVLSFAFTAQAALVPERSKMASNLMRKIQFETMMNLNIENVKIPALIFLKEKADLSGADELSTKLEKNQYVYDQLTDVAIASQADLKDYLKKKKISYQAFYIMNVIAVYDASIDQLKTIAGRSDVELVLDNPKIAQRLPGVVSGKQNIPFGADASVDAAAPVGRNIVAIGADKVWTEYKVYGQDIVVAGQDTGVDWTHSALIKKYRGYSKDGTASHDYNWHDAIHKDNQGDTGNSCGIGTKAPCDDGDHGTHTMGTIVGSNEAQIVGVAPAAQWIACRNMDSGAGTPSTYIECFEWLLAPYKYGEDSMTAGKPELSADVINNSWGCPISEGCRGDEIVEALKAMEAAGVMVVVSAGNEGSACGSLETQPGSAVKNTVSVGAYSHANNTMAGFSNRGPSILDGSIGPSVVAPGVNITSTVPGDSFSGFMWSGTSMAGPHVAGVVALMWSANPALKGNVKATKDIIQKTANPLATNENCGGIAGNAIPNNTSGYGMVDAYKAVKAALEYKL
ncbi:MAG: S8 family serine peptidase [Bacteriovoracaceae bacterium]|nr:S8 family serine peptidase [Bacteriovoracaceae bacterium]